MKLLTVIAVLFCLASAERAIANADLDREFALESIGFIAASGDLGTPGVQGVRDAFREVFAGQSRFEANDGTDVARVLLHHVRPYDELIQDPSVLAEMALATRSQSLIRTQLTGPSSGFQIQMDWLMGSQLRPLIAYHRTIELEDGGGIRGDEARKKIGDVIRGLLRKLPWMGNVTARRGERVAVNVGSNRGIKTGDTLEIATLDKIIISNSAERVTRWQLRAVGAVELDSVSGDSSNGRIIRELPETPIAVDQKAVRVLPQNKIDIIGSTFETKTDEEPSGDDAESDSSSGPRGPHVEILPKPSHSNGGGGDDGEDSTNGESSPTSAAAEASSSTKSTDAKNQKSKKASAPTFCLPAWLGGGLWAGSLSTHFDYAQSSGASRDGGGLLIGARATGRTCFWSGFFIDGDLGDARSKYSENGSPSLAGTATTSFYKVSVGYAFNWSTASDIKKSPSLFVKLGRHSPSYNLPGSSSDPGGQFSYGVTFFGFGANFPIGSSAWRLEPEIESDLSDSPNEGIVSSGLKAREIAYSLDAIHTGKGHWWLHLKLEYLSDDLSDASNDHATQSSFTLSPMLTYVF